MRKIQNMPEPDEPTKQCSYHGCENVILSSNETGYCEVCRSLVIANGFRYCQDPTSPILDRRDPVFANALHLMTPDECVRAIERTEWLYLKLQKAAIDFKLDVHRKKRYDEAIESMKETRASATVRTPKAPKAKAAKGSKAEKLQSKAKELLGDEFNDF